MNNDDRFRSLYQRFFLKIVRFFMRSFHLSEDDARDLTQETFLRVYRAIEEYRGDAEWAFLETTARHVAFNKIRAQNTAKRRGKTEDIDDLKTREPAALPGPDYAERQEQAIRVRQLRDAVAELPAGQRQCIRLQLDGFRYHEIAKFLGVSEDAVKSRRRDGLKRLREKLGAGALPEEYES